jgi:adenylate cyclase
MTGYLIDKIKKITVTLRFSILTIFITLFVSAMLAIIVLTYFRSAASLTELGFRLIQESSIIAFKEINDELLNAEIKNKSAAEVFHLGIVDPKNKPEIDGYLLNLLQNESALFPIVHSIFWGDVDGSFVMSEKIEEGGLRSEVIDRSGKLPTRKIIERNPKGQIIKSYFSPDLSYDPRIRPWFLAAKNAKTTVWAEIYKFRITKHLGTSVSTPIYNANGDLLGVLSLNVRLDYIRHVVENIRLGRHGYTFIVSAKGDLVAFPHVPQVQHDALMNIHALSDYPWVAASFDQFKKDAKPYFHLIYKDTNYLVSYRPFPNFGADRWLIGCIVPVDDFIGALSKTNIYTTVISLIILVLGIIIISYLVNKLVSPLKKIKTEIDYIKDFNLADRARIFSRIKEIAFISDALYSMKLGLRAFQKYVPSGLVRQLIESGEEAHIGGSKRPLAVLFSDIKDFTSIAEHISPDQLTAQLHEYFDALSQIITQEHGTIDKYIGDSIMAFWGAPIAEEHTAQHAAKAALICIKRSKELNTQWKKEGKPELYTRIGINLGEAIVGNFGSSERLSYTAIGDTINTASRLEGVNKVYGTQILVSEPVYQQIKNQFILRLIDCVILKGKEEKNYIYELIAETSEEVTYDAAQYNNVFEKGFAAYQNQEWDKAIEYFNQCLQIYPEDHVAVVFIERSQAMMKTEPAK